LDESRLMQVQIHDREIEELAKIKLSEEMVDQQLSNIIAELEFVEEWKSTSTRYEVIMGGQDDLPFDLYEELEALGEVMFGHNNPPLFL